MLILLETHSVSRAEGVRLALLAEGIDAEVLDRAWSGTLGVAGSIRVAILDDDDLARATEVVSGLEPPKSGPAPSWRWHKRAMLALVTGFVLMFLVTPVAESASNYSLRLLSTVSSAVLLSGALLFLLLGYRADRRRTNDE